MAQAKDDLSAGYLTEELRRPFGSKGVVVLETAVSCLDVRREHIDGITETMLKTTTDRILFLMFSRWNGENVVTYSGRA